MYLVTSKDVVRKMKRNKVISDFADLLCHVYCVCAWSLVSFSDIYVYYIFEYKVFSFSDSKMRA